MLSNPKGRRPSAHKKTWIPDANAKCCMRCGAGFHFFFRRHHCRRCGFVVCSSCSSKTLDLPGFKKRQRVCDECTSELKKEKQVKSQFVNSLQKQLDKKRLSQEAEANAAKEKTFTTCEKEVKIDPKKPESDPEVKPSSEPEKAEEEDDGAYDYGTMLVRNDKPAPSLGTVLIRFKGEEPPQNVIDVEPYELFNALMAGSLLVIDVRPAVEFRAGALPRSINVEISDSDGSIESVVEGLAERERMLLRRRRVMDVVVISKTGTQDASDPARKFASLVPDSLSVSVLQGGYDGFAALYPFAMEKNYPLPWYPTIVLDDFLYLGGESDARNLKNLEDLNISRILNVSSEVKNLYPDKFEYMQINVDDDPSCKIDKHFPKAFKFLDKAFEDKKRVLVHCFEGLTTLGVSRSSTIVIAYLMQRQNWNLYETGMFLKGQRLLVQPNPGFRKQLGSYENRLCGVSTLNEAIRDLFT